MPRRASTLMKCMAVDAMTVMSAAEAALVATTAPIRPANAAAAIFKRALMFASRRFGFDEQVIATLMAGDTSTSWPGWRGIGCHHPGLETSTLGDESDARSTGGVHWRALQIQRAPPQP